nr:hypothetical protein [Pelosinus baikalensis]
MTLEQRVTNLEKVVAELIKLQLEERPQTKAFQDSMEQLAAILPVIQELKSDEYDKITVPTVTLFKSSAGLIDEKLGTTINHLSAQIDLLNENLSCVAALLGYFSSRQQAIDLTAMNAGRASRVLLSEESHKKQSCLGSNS